MALHAMLTDLQRLDKEIETLRDERQHITWELEKLALVWHKRYPEKPHDRDRLCCTAGRFVFDDFVDAADGGVLRFGTRCTWDGPDAASGAVINAAWFERALEDADKAQDGATT